MAPDSVRRGCSSRANPRTRRTCPGGRAAAAGMRRRAGRPGRIVGRGRTCADSGQRAPRRCRADLESRHKEGARGGAVVTDRQTSGTNGGTPVTRGKGDGPFFAATAAGLFLFALVNTFSVLDDMEGAGRTLDFWEPFVWETTSIAVILAMMPVFMALVRRVWPLDPPWPRAAVVHLAGPVAFAVAHVTAMGAARWAVYAAVGAHYSPVWPLANFIYEFRKDALAYTGFVLLYVLWRQHLRPRTEAVAAPEATEGRDGG